MENNSSSPVVAPQPGRPVFLMVLCILTFIGSTVGVIGGIVNYISAKTAAELVKAATEDAQQKLEASDNGANKLAEKMMSGIEPMQNPENIRKNALFKVAGSLLTLLGGILMFNLRKIGFWSYILGTIIAVTGPFVAFGTGNILGILSSSVLAFIGILFVVLYSLNLKYLK
jgi:hypothetical protein